MDSTTEMGLDRRKKAFEMKIRIIYLKYPEQTEDLYMLHENRAIATIIIGNLQEFIENDIESSAH